MEQVLLPNVSELAVIRWYLGQYSLCCCMRMAVSIPYCVTPGGGYLIRCTNSRRCALSQSMCGTAAPGYKRICSNGLHDLAPLFLRTSLPVGTPLLSLATQGDTGLNQDPHHCAFWQSHKCATSHKRPPLPHTQKANVQRSRDRNSPWEKSREPA